MRTSVTLQIQDDVAELALVPPDERKPPTLEHAVLDELDAHLATLEARSDVRLVVVRSRSPKFFCVGANIGVLTGIDHQSIVPWVEHGHRVFNRLESLPCPVLARVEGYAMGGGLELAMAADMIFASATAQFAQPEAKLGLIPGWGGSWRLPRRVGLGRAKELAFSGRIIPASEAATIGLIEFCGASDALEQRCEAFTKDLRGCTALAVREVKRLISLAPTLTREGSLQAEVGSSVTTLSSVETPARIAAFVATRKG